ncbi:MAG: hypothetical protein U9Q29_01780 [Campylobacterota bacterium]|nr:hypothetical protein [Campylobacterota bacterium]
MKKIILFFLIISAVHSENSQKESSIFNMIAKSIASKTEPTVYIHTEIKSLQLFPGDLRIVKECKEADIVILSTIKNIPAECKGKLLFGTRYFHLDKRDVIGAFFWQKGRPNILFYKKRLELNGIKLDSSYNKYIEK